MPKRSKDKKKFVLIDVNALVHRAYHAYPDTLTVDGKLVNAAYGFTVLLFEVLKKFDPEYIVCSMDVSKSKKRLELFADYKGTRKPTDQALINQLPMVEEIINSLKIQMYTKEGYEADDVIGTIVNMKNIEGNPDLDTIIVTGDKDIFQLVDADTFVYLSGNSFSKSRLYDVEGVKEKMGFGPEYVVDYKALRGDPSDNIPGVAGVGDKSAKLLIQKFGHLDNILKNIEKIEQSRAKTAISKGIEEAKLSHELAKIDTDIDLDFELSKVQFDKNGLTDFIEVCKKYRFRSILRQLKNFAPESGDLETAQIGMFGKPSKEFEQADVDYKILEASTLKSFLDELSRTKEFAFDVESDSLEFMQAKTLGISFSFKPKTAFYLRFDLLTGVFLERLKKIFEDSKIKKIGHNIKFDMHMLANEGILVRGVYFDSMIAAYLLKMGEGGVGLKQLAYEYFGMNMVEYKELIKLAEVKNRLDSVPLEKLGKYSCADSDATFRLYENLSEDLNDLPELKQLFETIEMPLVEVLFYMEREGIGLDQKYLKDFSKQLDKKINELTDRIFELAGLDFNLNSPKQLGEVLFGKLGLSAIKKTSTGAHSTNERVLREIRSQHEIIDLILEYREVAKLRSTYTDALLDQIDVTTHKIHSSFNQAVASTGRLSSSDPNLQNIPVSSDLGNQIREAFVPEKGKIFVSLDYSQQELRILASVADDKELRTSYRKNLDVHAFTASKLFGVPIEKVDKNQRAQGKTVNFSVIYGISAFGLSDRLKIPREMAQEFIDKYFESYPQVRKFFDSLLADAKLKGFVQTKEGRRRDAAGLRSRFFNVRKAVEREVINFPIQAGAADMMKRAMIRVHEELQQAKWKGFVMVLQVHDELLFEIPLPKSVGGGSKDKILESLKKDKKITEFMEMVGEVMQEANMYDVAMKVDVGIGGRWGSIEEIGL